MPAKPTSSTCSASCSGVIAAIASEVSGETAVGTVTASSAPSPRMKAHQAATAIAAIRATAIVRRRAIACLDGPLESSILGPTLFWSKDG